MENDIPSKWKPKDGEAILVSNKRDFKPKVVMKVKGYSIMIKRVNSPRKQFSDTQGVSTKGELQNP